MKKSIVVFMAVVCLAAAQGPPARAQAVFSADFSKGSFSALGWEVKGDWDVFEYPKTAGKNPGRVARFAANKPAGSLVKVFPEVKNPERLALSLDYGWGWGESGQAADAIGVMLLDAREAGYLFEIHRTKANWAVQWAKVVAGKPADEHVWAGEEIDATHAAIRDGGGLSSLAISRTSDGTWTISNPDWNQGQGATVVFTDPSVSSFSRLVLMGAPNFDELAFNNIKLTAAGGSAGGGISAIPASSFLNSLGINSTFPDRGQPLAKTIEMIRYCGFRWVRGGIEGLSTEGPTTLETYLELHRETGVKFSWGLVSGGTDLKKLTTTARRLAAADALLAFEGNNEPNNWGVTYKGEAGGGKAPTWLAVAKLQRDLYESVKRDPMLAKYPVWSISEGGAELDNVGLQFLTIPQGASTVLPAGTRFADFANVHNYIYHPGSPGLADNKTWNAADPTSACKVDGLYGNYGRTWAKHYKGYGEGELLTLPRVTTETGCTIDGQVTEDIQAKNLLTLYLDQFKRGWRHTSVYLLRDRTDEGGNQSFGFFRSDYSPRKAAVFLHNLTTILADKGAIEKPGALGYALSPHPATVHDMLLQRSDGTLFVVIWGERLQGADEVAINFGKTFSSVEVFDPTLSAEPVRSHKTIDRVTLSLSDHPLILRLASP